MSIGKYLSKIQNPIIKITRILETAQELRKQFEEIETMDVIQQEAYSRQAEAAQKQLLQTADTLDREVELNNKLTKTNRMLVERIESLIEIFKMKDESIKTLFSKVQVLKEFKHRKLTHIKSCVKRKLKSLKEKRK